jgi:hypothetical protein
LGVGFLELLWRRNGVGVKVSLEFSFGIEDMILVSVS